MNFAVELSEDHNPLDAMMYTLLRIQSEWPEAVAVYKGGTIFYRRVSSVALCDGYTAYPDYDQYLTASLMRCPVDMINVSYRPGILRFESEAPGGIALAEKLANLPGWSYKVSVESGIRDG